MLYLLLAILSSSMITIFMRIGENKIRNNMGMFMTNYAICVVLSRYFMGRTSLFSAGDGVFFAVGLGLFTGIMFLTNFSFMQWNMRQNGVVLTTTFTKLGVIVPTIMAFLVFHEEPGLLQTLGIFTALAAIILLHFDRTGAGSRGGKKIFLIFLLLCSGFTESLTNIFDKMGVSSAKDHFLLCTFFAALVLALIIGLAQKEKFSPWDFIFGFLIGIPNYFSSRFMLLALENVPSVIAYPLCSVGIIVVVSIAGVLFFKEEISRQKKMALGLVMLALVLLNL